MLKRASIHVLLTLLAIGIALPALAIQPGTDRALNAFRRYEPDFQRWQRDLAALARRVAEQKIKLDSADGRLLRDQAREIFESAQKRYELLEDLEKDTAHLYPEDRAALFDGWSRIEDSFQACRNQYDTFNEESSKTPQTTPKPADNASPRAKPEPAAGQPQTQAPAPVKPAEAPTATVVPPALPDSGSAAAVTTAKKADRFFIGGNLKLEFRNKNERYTAENTALPNNLSQGQLELRYQLNSQDKLVFQDKYVKRRRNEDVRENQAILTYFHEHSKSTQWALKDTYYNIWYPENRVKEYRDNLFEYILNRKETNKGQQIERLYNLGYKMRDYPNYSQSNFRQWNVINENTYYIRDGIFYTDLNVNGRAYQNTATLDYKNLTWGTDYNRSFKGNHSEVGFTNTYDWRRYDTENANLFRTSYWDNFFQFRYQVPASKKWTWAFEDEYQMRDYASDEGRGYARMQLKTTGTIKIDKKSTGRVQHTYVYADENTRSRAHANHIFAGMYERKFTDKFRGKIDANRHRRWSLAGNLLDFGQGQVTGKLTWILPSRIELVWQNEYLDRGYETNYYNSFRYFTTGVVLAYSKPKKVDWSILGQLQYLKYDAANAASPYARVDGSSNLNKVEGRYNFWIGKDKRIKLLASAEKTYYKTFDNLSQELQLDFTRPMTITEFTGELELLF